MRVGGNDQIIHRLNYMYVRKGNVLLIIIVYRTYIELYMAPEGRVSSPGCGNESRRIVVLTVAGSARLRQHVTARRALQRQPPRPAAARGKPKPVLELGTTP